MSTDPVERQVGEIIAEFIIGRPFMSAGSAPDVVDEIRMVALATLQHDSDTRH